MSWQRIKLCPPLPTLPWGEDWARAPQPFHSAHPIAAALSLVALSITAWVFWIIYRVRKELQRQAAFKKAQHDYLVKVRGHLPPDGKVPVDNYGMPIKSMAQIRRQMMEKTMADDPFHKEKP